eukprot:385378-Hanusia_phi.AAC.1
MSAGGGQRCHEEGEVWDGWHSLHYHSQRQQQALYRDGDGWGAVIRQVLRRAGCERGLRLCVLRGDVSCCAFEEVLGEFQTHYYY